MFDMENISLKFSDDALKEVAKRAVTRKTGARGLRSIMEGILLSSMYELPDLKNVEEVIISGDVVQGKAEPLYVYGNTKKEKEKAAAEPSA